MLRRLPTIEFRDAHISADGIYRYWLERRWSGASDTSPMIVWAGLNPSKADGKKDDPTIRRMIGFTHSWGFARMMVVNLYAYRATNPRDLEGLTLEELEGPGNREALYRWSQSPDTRIFICCWGTNRFKCVPIPHVIPSTTRYALGFNVDGSPKHPLYLPAGAQLMRIN